jgi:hypothetical protein
LGGAAGRQQDDHGKQRCHPYPLHSPRPSLIESV